MSIVRLAPRVSRYTQIQNDTLQDLRMSLEARGVLCYVLSKSETWSVYQSQLAKEHRVGKDKMQRIFNELIELGYVVEEHNREAGKFHGINYIFHEVPVKGYATAAVITGAGKTGAGKTGAGKSASRNNRLKKDTTTRNTSSSSSDDGRALSMEKQFEGIWQAYPRKVGKQAAFRAFQARRREGIAFDLLAQAVRNYADLRRGQDQKFTMHASTFFGPDKKYEDYLDGGAAFEVDKSLTAEGWFEQRRQRNAVDRG